MVEIILKLYSSMQLELCQTSIVDTELSVAILAGGARTSYTVARPVNDASHITYLPFPRFPFFAVAYLRRIKCVVLCFSFFQPTSTNCTFYLTKSVQSVITLLWSAVIKHLPDMGDTINMKEIFPELGLPLLTCSSDPHN